MKTDAKTWLTDRCAPVWMPRASFKSMFGVNVVPLPGWCGWILDAVGDGSEGSMLLLREVRLERGERCGVEKLLAFLLCVGDGTMLPENLLSYPAPRKSMRCPHVSSRLGRIQCERRERKRCNAPEPHDDVEKRRSCTVSSSFWLCAGGRPTPFRILRKHLFSRSSAVAKPHIQSDTWCYHRNAPKGRSPSAILRAASVSSMGSGPGRL